MKRSVIVTAVVLTTALAVWSRDTTGDRAVPASRFLEQTINLRPEVLRLALTAFDRAESEGHVQRRRLTIIDYELPSYEKRLWVLDFETQEVLFEEWVAHGMGKPRGTGGDMDRAKAFSNEVGSRCSSLGLYLTAGTYQGRHGYTLRLDGLETGFNDAARERLIVLHSAEYVSADRAEEHLIGRSWGCPVVRREVSKKLIDAIKEGSVLWVYFPGEEWLEGSGYLDR
jgi:hypothetical protein